MRTVSRAPCARDDLLRVLDEQSALKMQLAAAVSDYDQRIANGDERVNEARARRDEAKTLLEQTELRAPLAGTLESLRAHPGQVIQPAEWIARVVSEQAPRTIVAFVPERDAAFLAVGATAHVLAAAAAARTAQNERYGIGVASLLDLLDAEGIEQNARRSRIEAERDHRVARVRLLALCGEFETLER